MPKVRPTSESKKKTADRAHNFQFNTSGFGQHILKNPLVVKGIIEKAELRATDVVLEIGPGTGNLTAQMVPLVKKVIAVEIDPRMASELQKRISSTQYGNKLQIILGDFLKVDLPYFDVCVANCPYNISSPLTFKLLSQRPLFRTAVLMFQREFALRMCAKPGEPLYCRLSANCGLLANVTHVMKVGKNNFRPPPKVESSVVRVRPFDPPPPINFLEWDGLLRLCFTRKNKTLGAIFRQNTVIDVLKKNLLAFCALKSLEPPEEDVKTMSLSILEETDFGEKRASKLDTDDFLKLLEAFNKKNIHFC